MKRRGGKRRPGHGGHDEAPGRQTIGGLHPVRETLEAGVRRCHALFLARSPRDLDIQPILKLAQRRGVRVHYVESSDVERRGGGINHQGVLLEVEPHRPVSLGEALDGAGASNATVWMGLDEITDPHNFGAILRVAACFGASTILHTDRRSAKLTPLVQKIASGAAEYVRVVEETNLNASILKLKKAGFWVYGAALEGRPMEQVKFHGPALVLIGSEGKGLREKTREHCDELVRIPQAEGGVASLNASCAAAVMLYEVSRQIRATRA